MTKNIPQYLKLHVEDDSALPRPKATDIGGLGTLCHAFEQLTGWQLGLATGSNQTSERSWCMDLELPDNDKSSLTMRPSGDSSNAIPLQEAQPLAQAIGQILGEVQRTRHVVWQREAELATAIPVTIRPDDQHSVADRLEAVLRGGANAIGCQAAALYLLDDATSVLKIRSCWGLSKTRFLDPPRPLRGAVSDLEALVGHAVALEDTSLLPHWKVPEDYPAALCVPVASANTPLGTLWFFADQVREFTEEQTNVAEIIAGRMVAELERQVLARSGRKGQNDPKRLDSNALRAIAGQQNDHLPSITPIVDGWQVAGKIKRGQVIGGDLFDWSVLPDGQLAVALGHANGRSVDAALTATMIHTAMKSHAAHKHNARQMLERLNETLWSSSKGDRFVSAFYGIIDPENGKLEFATAGQVGAIICGPETCDVLDQNSPMLGRDPDSHFLVGHRQIEPNQTLVLYGSGVSGILDTVDDEPIPLRLAAELQAVTRPTAEEQVDLILDYATDQTTDDVSLVTARRLF